MQMITKKTVLAILYGAIIWLVGETGGPVYAAVMVGTTTVAYSLHADRKMTELEQRLTDLSWRLRHVIKDE
ncbi:hypothetical protein AU381_27140 [Sinorhizobium glycinis]|uniref:Uncharacterized protein n=2 Tax=Sinorhizobium glycinis TaxID=1472378 RepID=A0A178Y7E3_9HYPH|nr:hypothetical protein AU381_27140 [Sinorhizobium glycinis]